MSIAIVISAIAATIYLGLAVAFAVLIGKCINEADRQHAAFKSDLRKLQQGSYNPQDRAA